MMKISILLLFTAVIFLSTVLKTHAEDKPKYSLIYSSSYNISLGGLENFHPFDSEKYGRVFDYLSEKFDISKGDYYEPVKAEDSTLLKTHSVNYLKSLDRSENIAKIAELKVLAMMDNKMLQEGILDPMKYAVSGTIEGVVIAMQRGWAVNLSGGYHHAKAGSGGGFCFFADVPLALKIYREKNPGLKALIIDLDAHQGNGFEDILGPDTLTYIYDQYNEDNYPYDDDVKKFIDFNNPMPGNSGDDAYLEILKSNLPDALAGCRPDIIIYNAGTDVYEKDNLGGLNLTMGGIIERDEFVFRQALDNNIPVLMVLSGGYHKDSWMIISKSLENIMKNVVKI